METIGLAGGLIWVGVASACGGEEFDAASSSPGASVTSGQVGVEPSDGTATTWVQQESVAECDLIDQTDLDMFGDVTFDHLEGLAPGERPVRMTAPNGEVVELPRPNPCDPEQLLKSGLSLIACYVSTSDETCLDALTGRESVKHEIRSMRDGLTEHSTDTTGVQLAIFSGRADPAKFTVTTVNRQTVVELRRGELRFERLVDNFGDNAWQGAWTREFAGQPPRMWVASEFRMTFGLRPEDGAARMMFFDYSLDGVG